MKTTTLSILAGFLLTAMPVAEAQAQQQWTLRDCIDYAMEHNIQLKQNALQQESSSEDVKQSKAALLPSLSFSTNQSLSYRPFPNGGGTTVTNGFIDTKVSSTTYNGSYGLNANWTVWNGNRNRNTVRQNELAEQKAALTAEQTANSIQEQIAQLYVQILYNTESINVCKQVLEFSKANLERGKAMMTAGAIARADVAQLEAQVASDEYSLVAAEGQVARFKMQLKQLLELTGPQDFTIAVPAASDDAALAVIPSLNDAYNVALQKRPEMKSAQLGIESAKLQQEIAKAGNLPTIGVNGSIGASTSSGSSNSWGKQMKSNLNGGVGVNLSQPIFDQRQTRTNVNKARIQLEEQQLQLQNAEKELWSTIEGYWLDANTNQARFRSAQISTQSAQESYNLVSEQFKEGLKNIQELTTGKSTLLNAEQSRLESKYTTILSIQMLKFYSGEEINL